MLPCVQHPLGGQGGSLTPTTPTRASLHWAARWSVATARPKHFAQLPQLSGVIYSLATLVNDAIEQQNSVLTLVLDLSSDISSWDPMLIFSPAARAFSARNSSSKCAICGTKREV